MSDTRKSLTANLMWIVRFLRWSRRFLWLRHRHPSFVMSCSFTNRGRLLADGPWVVCMRMALGRLLADGPRSSTDGPWFPKRVVYGWPVVVYGWPVVIVRMAREPSTDDPWSSADGSNPCMYVADIRSANCAADLGQGCCHARCCATTGATVRKSVETPQLKILDNFIDMPTVALRQVPIVRIVQKPVEIPLLQIGQSC